MDKDFTVYGITARTNNKTEMGRDGRIGPLWEKFFKDQVLAKVPDRLSDEIVAVYSNYDSDFNGNYDYTIGFKTRATQNVEGLNSVTVKAGRYAHLKSARGPSVKMIVELWQKVWTMTANDLGGERAYKTDFEVYGAEARDPGNAVVELFLGLK